MQKLESSTKLRISGIAIGVVIGGIFALISFFWSNSQPVSVGILVALLIAVLTFEIIIKLREVETEAIDNISNIRMERDALAKITDGQFHSKYHQLKDELKQLNNELKQLLVENQYHISSLDQIYEDDRRSINELS